MLKHIPEKPLELFENTLWYSKKITLENSRDRRQNKANHEDYQLDANLADRNTRFRNIIDAETVYKIPLNFNFHVKF